LRPNFFMKFGAERALIIAKFDDGDGSRGWAQAGIIIFRNRVAFDLLGILGGLADGINHCLRSSGDRLLFSGASPKQETNRKSGDKRQGEKHGV
jgi:hypothetical protein